MSEPDTTTLPTSELAALETRLEFAEEAAFDAERLLAAEDAGWDPLTGSQAELITRDQLRKGSHLARLMTIGDPLISRGVNLRVAYVFGQGVSIAAHEAPGQDSSLQDVNGLVQAFLEDNAETFTSAQAREDMERSFATDGNLFLALPTDPVTGRVRVRAIPTDEVAEIIANPEDAAEPWFYERTYTTTTLDLVGAGRQAVTRSQTVTIYYPDVTYRPSRRPTMLNGHRIEWDKPVVHGHVNRPTSGTAFGVPDTWAALPWARGYKDFLTDWAGLVKALSRFAFRATAKNGTRASQVRGRLETGPADGVGGTAIMPEGQSFEAIGKSGATIDAGSGKPLAGMVAAALDIPVTMLLADPGSTGARAVAETLDRPLANTIRMRRDVHAALIRKVLDYVIDRAIASPSGPLRGLRQVDRFTGRESWLLTGAQDRGIDIDWPSLEDVDVKTLIEALVNADSTGYLPPLVVLRMLLVALDVDNPDLVLESVTDDAGNFIDPRATVAAAAGSRAARAHRDGADPAAALNAQD